MLCEITKIRVLSKEEPNNVLCKNCGIRVDDINIHYRTSLICGQTLSSHGYPDGANSSKSILIGNKRKNDKTEKKVQHKCLACGKEFVNLKVHLSKSFPCQAPYDIDDKIEKKKLVRVVRKVLLIFYCTLKGLRAAKIFMT